jgi:hypothetical protein
VWRAWLARGFGVVARRCGVGSCIEVDARGGLAGGVPAPFRARDRVVAGRRLRWGARRPGNVAGAGMGRRAAQWIGVGGGGTHGSRVPAFALAAKSLMAWSMCWSQARASSVVVGVLGVLRGRPNRKPWTCAMTHSTRLRSWDGPGVGGFRLNKAGVDIEHVGNFGKGFFAGWFGWG